MASRKNPEAARRNGNQSGGGANRNAAQALADKIKDKVNVWRHFWSAWKHTKMYTFVSAVITLLYLLCLFSNDIIIGWDTCNEGHFSKTIGCRDHTKSCGIDDDCRYYYNAGLFQADWGDGSQPVCDGVFPLDNVTGLDHAMCGPLKSTRALFVVSALCAGVSFILGMYYNFSSNYKEEREDPDKIPKWMSAQIILQLAGAGLSCCAFGLFQNKVIAVYEEELQKAAMIMSPNILDSSYYSTLGYTFGVFVCVWVWPFTVLGTKSFFNHLEIEKVEGDQVPSFACC